MEIPQSELEDLVQRQIQSSRIIWSLIRQLGGTARLFDGVDYIDPFWQLEFSEERADGRRCLVISATTKPPFPETLPSDNPIKPQ